MPIGIGINYLYDNILFVVSSFFIISALFTFLGFYLGRKINNKIGKYSFLLGSITLFIYSILVLTKWGLCAIICGIQSRRGDFDD